MKSVKFELLIIMTMISFGLLAQDLTQTLRGNAIDKDSKMPLIGANIIILETDPILGASADLEGNFFIENVPVGRVNIQISALGYETQTLSNIIVESGKETVLNIESIESFQTLNAVTVKGTKRNETVNKMASVSAKTVTVEETGRYAGSLNDPSRMVTSFAGVSADASGNNDIVVRGNSPRGILWKLEGVEIPNPNHFAGEGRTGGPVNALNASMLSNSDFFSGAFAPEYGNALSGVFDVKFRKGNNQKREQSFSVGVIGTDITLEGPLKRGYKGSYLVNYRYSTLEMLYASGIVDYGGIPRYQDASFKIFLPSQKAGNFSIFGLGGKSSITQDRKDEDTEQLMGSNEEKAALGIVGVKHNYIINEKTYVQSYLSASGTLNGGDGTNLDQAKGTFYDAYNNEFTEMKYKASSALNKKINNRNTINTGLIYTQMSYNLTAKDNHNNTTPIIRINTEGHTSMMQAYTTWKHRFSEDLTMVAGVHYTQLFLNQNYALEPRLGLKWQMNSQQYLSLGLGMHSKVENLSVYMAASDDNDSFYKNKNLDLTKAIHYVLGYGNQLNESVFFKAEVYYQDLYDVPVEDLADSKFSMLNAVGVTSNTGLVNKGTGRNYGVELTLERFFSNKYYYMMSSSLYESKYTAMDGVERNSRFSANYASNVVFGKEFALSSKKNNKTIAVNAKISHLGGNRYSPIDLEASIQKGQTVYDENQIFSKKGNDIFSLNLGVTYRINRKKTTHEIKIDVQNLTNNKAVVGRYYDSDKRQIMSFQQLAMIPNIMYIIKF